MGTIWAICISEQKGTPKHDVAEAQLKVDWGIEGDAHAANWHRQVSLLNREKIEDFKAKGAPVENGAFGENLIVTDIDFSTLPLGTRFRSGNVLLELTQIGKECHHGCAIRQIMGDCIMPREGVFCRVLQGGTLHPGEQLDIVKEEAPCPTELS